MYPVESSDGSILLVKIGFMIPVKSHDVRIFYHFFAGDHKWSYSFG